ncbi:hypothetical protein [Chengkuizengella axinellae]|uniref:Uncharacterized protein n=1 Tax=Chengkuizengella axinellae TaxID=3064388 RepID=A0ABT9J5N3_9BACL|nr:hypothetical protein [Chengkuizengella sp. 2205SS18-9]MDP5276793.1 hypothetical protein [Chengkuizengella sp. 2205SS18-9]
MKRKIFSTIAAVLLVFTVVLSACGEKAESPKELLKEANEKALEMESYSFDGNMNLSMNIPAEAMSEAPEMAMFAGMFQNINLDVSGVYQQDPMKMEMVMDLEIPGDMSFNFSLPMVMEQDKMLIKVPNIPFVPLPQEITGKFIEIDYNELAEQSGEEIMPFVYGDLQKQNELVMEMSNIFFSHYGDEYFTLVADDQLPEGTDIEKAVEMKLTNENVQKAALTFMDNVLPELLELLADPKYAEVLQIDPADVEVTKEELADARSELVAFFEDEQNTVKVNDLTFVNGINSDDYISYQGMTMDIDAITEGQSVNVVLDMFMEMSQINQNPDFTVEVSPDDVITLQELEEIMNSTFGAFEATPEPMEIEGLEELTEEEIEALLEETMSN